MTHLETQYIFETERAVLRLLGADCSAPVAAFAEMEGEVIRLRAMYGEGHAEGKAPVAARLQLCLLYTSRFYSAPLRPFLSSHGRNCSSSAGWHAGYCQAFCVLFPEAHIALPSSLHQKAP